MIDWLETIPTKKLRSDVKKKYPRIRRLYHIIVSLDYQLTTTTYTSEGHGCSDYPWLSIITQEQLPQV
jgi:hypothetical protein